MTAFTDKTAEISRKPIQLVVITLDFCSLEFGVSPCTATASDKCYNTFFTSRDPDNFTKTTKDYKFTSFSAPVPFGGVLPYVQSVKLLPTEIGKEITVQGRVKINMVDEPSDDISTDPYLSSRSSVQGEFWKKLVARNPNYKGRPVSILEGYLGLDENEFVERWKGTLDNITISGGKVVVECVDSMADLSSVSYPGKMDVELNANITESTPVITLSSLIKEDETQIDSAGYVQIDDEIIEYSSLVVASNQIVVAERGAFNTGAASHDAEARVTLVKYFEPDNPFTHLKTIWDNAGGDYTVDFDTAEWDKWQSWPKTDVDFSAIITEDQESDGKDLFWEIANILDLHIWQDENQKITVRRNMGNDPDRSYIDISDTANIIVNSGSVDYNEEDRKTRIYHFWNKSVLSDFDDTSGYDRVTIKALLNEESEDGFGDVAIDEIFNRWVSLRFLPAKDVIPFVTALTNRRALNRSKARPLIKVSVEIKDEAVKTGDVVKLTTDERLDINGNQIIINHIVIKREPKQGKIILTLKELPQRRICIIAPAGNPDYASASNDQRQYGFIASGKDKLMPNGDAGYHIW